MAFKDFFQTLVTKTLFYSQANQYYSILGPLTENLTLTS